MNIRFCFEASYTPPEPDRRTIPSLLRGGWSPFHALASARSADGLVLFSELSPVIECLSYPSLIDEVNEVTKVAGSPVVNLGMGRGLEQIHPGGNYLLLARLELRPIEFIVFGVTESDLRLIESWNDGRSAIWHSCVFESHRHRAVSWREHVDTKCGLQLTAEASTPCFGTVCILQVTPKQRSFFAQNSIFGYPHGVEYSVCEGELLYFCTNQDGLRHGAIWYEKEVSYWVQGECVSGDVYDSALKNDGTLPSTTDFRRGISLVQNLAIFIGEGKTDYEVPLVAGCWTPRKQL